MDYEQIITESDLRTRFNNERDMVTLSPYRVGDRVVRCSSCRTIVKSEFISGGCPICGHSPFLPAPVSTRAVGTSAIETRSLTPLLWLLLLSAAVSLLPFAFPSMAEFLYEATFGIGFCYSMLCVGAVGVVAALITYNNSNGRRMWRNADGGFLLLLIPAGTPYLLLAAIWAVIFVLSIIIAIACIAFVFGIIVCIFE